MMGLVALKYSLFFLAGAFNAVMDTLTHHFSTSIFKSWNAQFWNPEISWKNKYKMGDPRYGRKKLLGINVPVVFTDGWHPTKFLMLLCLYFSATLPDSDVSIIYNVLAFGTLFWAGFELFYSWILVRK